MDDFESKILDAANKLKKYADIQKRVQDALDGEDYMIRWSTGPRGEKTYDNFDLPKDVAAKLIRKHFDKVVRELKKSAEDAVTDLIAECQLEGGHC